MVAVERLAGLIPAACYEVVVAAIQKLVCGDKPVPESPAVAGDTGTYLRAVRMEGAKFVLHASGEFYSSAFCTAEGELKQSLYDEGAVERGCFTSTIFVDVKIEGRTTSGHEYRVVAGHSGTVLVDIPPDGSETFRPEALATAVRQFAKVPMSHLSDAEEAYRQDCERRLAVWRMHNSRKQ